jgi:hypothetical protein
MSVHLAQSPFFTREERVEDPVALTSLFESERLPMVGSGFFDQRFVNYLSQRPELQDINWRQFEGLAAEWLARSGYVVELGSGRNDGSVDVRAWSADAKPDTPPVLIVQCKREKRKIGKVVVKALWADMHAERADAGLMNMFPAVVEEELYWRVDRRFATKAPRGKNARREPKSIVAGIMCCATCGRLVTRVVKGIYVYEMFSQDPLEAAWQRTVLGWGSAPEVSRETNVSLRLVWYMRAVKEAYQGTDLKAETLRKKLGALEDNTWSSARNAYRGLETGEERSLQKKRFGGLDVEHGFVFRS